MDCHSSRPYRLANIIQNYAWGTRNSEAFIPELLGIDVEPDQAYAELWMGIHPNAPSSIIDLEAGQLSLSRWLSDMPRERLAVNGGLSNLPYLLKVLSAGEALSIQAHPNKQDAERLHQLDPEHYPDDNHKPEIAIALDFLDALVGFISNRQYLTLLEAYPEIKALIGSKANNIQNLREGVQALFHIGEHDEQYIVLTTKQIHQRIRNKKNPDEIEILFLEQFEKREPEDLGLLFLFLLNPIRLEPGEAVFLAPGVPHAYLKGNIIECMANSDNVVRLGLTNKFCDAQALNEILDYDSTSDFRVPQSKDGYLNTYVSPTSEFRVKALELPEGESELFTSRTSLTMFLVVEGEISLHWKGTDSSCSCVMRRGQSFITPASLNEFDILSRKDSKIYLVEIP